MDVRPSGRVGVDSVLAMPGTVAGYRLIRRRGRGGFAEVWEAEAPGGFRVALRLVRASERRQSTELRAIEIIRVIRHPHLLPIFGAWQVGGLLVIGMELADRSLWDRFVEARAQGLRGIPRRELLEYLAGAASGIDYLNAPHHTIDGRRGLGIQHRDLKPRNIMLFGACAKVADFGMVRALDGLATGHAPTWTVAYAAPEFFAGKSAPQSDQYSLAVTYGHMRGGLLPFSGSTAQVMAGHMLNAPDLEALPPSERPIVARALAKRPEDRWPDCRSFVDALRALADAEGGSGLDALPGDVSGDPADADAIFARSDPTAQAMAPIDRSDVSDFALSLSQDEHPALDPDDFSARSDFELSLSQDSLAAFEPSGSYAVSDFQVIASREDLPAKESGEFRAVSDFLVNALEDDESASREVSTLSDFQVLPRAEGESFGTREVPAPEGAGAPSSFTQAAARWDRPWGRFALGLLAVANVFLIFLVGRWASAHRPRPTAPVERPSVAKTAPASVKATPIVADVGHSSPRWKPAPLPSSPPPPRHVVSKPVLAANNEEGKVANPEAPAPKPAPRETVVAKPEPAKGAQAAEPQPVKDRALALAHVEKPSLVPKPKPKPEPAKARPPDDTPDEPKTAASHEAYERGQGHLARGAYGSAIEAFTEALRHDPKHHEAHVSRGMAHHFGGRYAQALADYNEAIRLKPDHATAYLLRGRIHQALGALDRAIEDLGAVIRLRPNDHAAYVERGRVHHRSGAYDQALADFGEAIRLRPKDPAPYYRRGLVRYQMGDERGAIADFDRALELDPRRAPVYLARSEAYARIGQYARAAADHDAFDRLSAEASTTSTPKRGDEGTAHAPAGRKPAAEPRR